MATLPQNEGLILSNSKTTLQNARDNQSDLALFGITQAMLDEFEQKINTAEALPSETHQRIALRDLTATKNELLIACMEWGKNLKTRLELAFGKNSTAYNAFPSKDLTSGGKSEAVMMPTMQIVIALAEQYAEDLAVFGQTAEVIQEGKNLLTSLRDADNAQEIKKDEKRSATEERHVLFTELYDTVNRINKVGKSVFAKNPVKLVLFQSKWQTGGGTEEPHVEP